MKQIETDAYLPKWKSRNRLKSDQNKQKRIRNGLKLTLVDSKLIETNWNGLKTNQN